MDHSIKPLILHFIYMTDCFFLMHYLIKAIRDYEKKFEIRKQILKMEVNLEKRSLITTISN